MGLVTQHMVISKLCKCREEVKVEDFNFVICVKVARVGVILEPVIFMHLK